MKAFIIGIGAATSVALIATGLYVDSRRRKDPLYRHRVNERREARLTRKKEEKAKMFAKILDGIVPPTDEESMRTYIDTCIAKAEQCIATGIDEGYRIAAHLFCKVATILPKPDYFIQTLEKNLNETVFQYFMELLHGVLQSNEDFSKKLLDPYELVGMKIDPSRPKKKVIIVTQDVKRGDTIFSEEPLVFALRPDQFTAKAYCFQCARAIDAESISDSIFESFQFCSTSCHDKAYDTFLTAWSKPEQIQLASAPLSSDSITLQNVAYQQLATFACESDDVERFVFSMVLRFSMKMLQATHSGSSPEEDIEHIKHLPQPEALSVDPKLLEKQLALFYQIMTQRSLPVDSILQLEMIVALVEIFSKNAIEFCTSPSSPNRYTGSAIYPIATFIDRSSDASANAQFVFEGTNRLIVRAVSDIDAGEEIICQSYDLE